ncbi:MAG TPA: TRAP transporter large permease [Methylomirabilota bacterium]|jgi:C4-dicarboxylate transporter DctM subunit|nr:TRAP transporter large permease [Methylomirabilota bacterium]
MIALTALAFVVLLLLAVPVAFTVGAAGFLGLWWSGAYPLSIIIQQMFLAVDSFVLLAIPLFILAGALMETGGIAIRLVRFAQALVGWIRGGLAMAVVIAEYIFSGISGSTIADVSAIGSTMIPPMTRAGYRPEEAVSVVAAASAMGILVPPCILMIVIGAIANVSVAALFVGGLIPALVLAAAIMVYIYLQARRGNMAPPRPTGPRELWRAFVGALIPLGLPLIIFGGILGGVMTPTEAAAVAVFYAAIVGLFVYREIRWSQVPEILVQSAVVTANVCFILATAAVVAWVLVVQQVPALLLTWMSAASAGPTLFLVLTAVLFILLGAVLEGLPAVVIVLPTFLPVVKQLDIDLVHYCIVVVAATGIGLFLPPIGVGLFIACGIANITVDRVVRPMLPYVLFLCVGLLIVILVPWFTLVLPRLFGL